MATKIELEKQLEELQKENNRLNMLLIQGQVVDLEEKAVAFSYKGNTIRVKVDNENKVRLSSDETGILIEPIGAMVMNLHFKKYMQ